MVIDTMVGSSSTYEGGGNEELPEIVMVPYNNHSLGTLIANPAIVFLLPLFKDHFGA